ncbi:MAG TPA: hypothetical protein VNA26_02940, partial [Chitinophagaceae bacterium]|nr:hypothetical protein [Chitinophagaceae bacterium]
MKKNTNRRTNRKKIAIVIGISLILLITSVVAYELIWQRAATVNSDILMAERIFLQHTKELWTVRFN